MDAPVNLALVGAGRMGSFHGKALREDSAVTISVVVDADPAAARSLAGAIDAEPSISLDDVIAMPGIDGWLIATSTPSHPEIVAMAIEGGVHALCEKPLSLDVELGAELGQRAAEQGLVLQVGFWRRFAPGWVAARRMIDTGAIGRPLLLRFAQWDADPPPPAFCDPAVSGGLAIDCGVHEYDLAEWLTGSQVTRVTARNLPVVSQAVGEAGDVDNLVAILDLANGAVATVDLSRNFRYADDVRTEILGSDGALFVDMLPEGSTRLATAGGLSIVEGSKAPDPMTSGVVAQARAFATAIRSEAGGFPGATASNRAVSIGRAVQAAALSGQSETV